MRVERIGDATLHLGDALELLQTLQGVDVVVADPPYGAGMPYGYDDSREALAELAPRWIEAALTICPRVVCTPGVQNIWLYPEPTWTGCWTIPGAGLRGMWGFACWQPILFYGDDPHLGYRSGARPDIIVLTERAERNGHPCPKPIDFMRRLVDRVSLHGECVCDPFMGSGTTGVACVQLGRRFIGIERNPLYFGIACRRIEQAQKQIALFPHEPVPKPVQLNLA